MSESPAGRPAAEVSAAVPSASSPSLDTPLVKVVGDKTAKVLGSQLDLHTVEDLLRHYPRRYADRGELTDLHSLQLDEHVTVFAQITKVTKRPMRNRRGSMLEVLVSDGQSRATLSLTFFNQVWRERELRVGRRGLFSGKVGDFRGNRQLTHPDYLLVGETEDSAEEFEKDATQVLAETDALSTFAAELLPVYPATAGLASWRIAQCVRIVLDVLDELPDPLPAEVRARHGLLDLTTALRRLHRPANRAEVRSASLRLRWEEAFVLQTVMAQRRAAAAALPAQPRVPVPGGLFDALEDRLPYELTAGQRTVEAEILADLARTSPMNRLLQGDVGAGKTILALRAMLAVADSGGQAALLAPTEVLAQQHYRSITGLLGPVGRRGELDGADVATRVTVLTGSSGTPARRRALLDAASGDAGIIIGTHALLQDPVDFFDLGLVVIDEQHRFGVEQRDKLRAKAGSPPHVLVMTATPIPRTVAMTVFGDLDISTLRELPGGRQPIQTTVVPVGEQPAWLDRVWRRVREEVAAGHRAYVVCPRIGLDTTGAAEDADGAGAPHEDDGPARRPPAAVVEVIEGLREGPLAGLRVEELHGRLAADVKDDRMRRFAAGDLDVLVATTVIEVGVDVPEATVMVILDADRFGVSQLHQLRGRVGRGSEPGLCLLISDLPPEAPARERLDAVAATSDGFELAQLDLEQRREGDVLGAVQSGRRSSLRLLSVLRDEELIGAAREEARAWVEGHPDLGGEPALARAVDALLGTERAEFLARA